MRIQSLAALRVLFYGSDTTIYRALCIGVDCQFGESSFITVKLIVQFYTLQVKFTASIHLCITSKNGPLPVCCECVLLLYDKKHFYLEKVTGINDFLKTLKRF